MKLSVPNYPTLISVTYKALKELGGSGTNEEINEKGAILLDLPDEILDILHTGSTSLSEFHYRMAWARTLLKKYGAIINSGRSVWSITSDFANIAEVDGATVRKKTHGSSIISGTTEASSTVVTEDVPEEVEPWRTELHNIIANMDPFGFERLTQRVLRESGFDPVEVTKKSGDGGIDGFGRLKINGFFSFNIAFQCKRYHGVVGASEIRDFRGSLATNVEKGIFITTGSFSKAAKEEASSPGKQQIDLIDGEAFVTKLIELGIGVEEKTIYQVNTEVFRTI